MANPLSEELLTIRKRVHELFMDSASGDGSSPAAGQVVMVLNEVLSIALLCLLRYERHYYFARRLNLDAAMQAFLKQARSKWGQADEIAERIVQLGGEPNFDPEMLFGRSPMEGSVVSLRSILREELAAERIASGTYADIAPWLSDKDLASRRLIERLLEREDERIEDLISLLPGPLAGEQDGNAPAAGAASH